MLRPFGEEDFEPLVRIYGDADVARWQYWGPRGHDEVRPLLDRAKAEIKIVREGDTLAVAVELAATGEFIGDCVLTLTSAAHAQGELGYLVDPAHQGRGYATEAAEAMLAIAFAELGLHRVTALIEARHAASRRVAERLGMHEEAHFAENVFVKGEWQSEQVYALLRRDWLTRRRERR